ncbi:DrmE family protein [Pseudomonadota bacterium]
MKNQDFVAALQHRFPLLDELLFFRNALRMPEPLPPVIGLMATMTDPELSGDTCCVVPSRERIAALTAVLAALTAARNRFPKLYKEYIEEGFEVGERVRVLPTGHVYEFGGFFAGDLFKLNVMRDGGSRSFHVKNAVLLEKTNGKSPKGTLRSRLGSYLPSPIDEMIGIESGGNEALLTNEIMLVTTQRSFSEFIEDIYVCRADNPRKQYPLRDVITWGVVGPEGSIDFRNSKAATGAPLIAVSPRTEYVAEACRRYGDIYPRVIIDGATRVKDLQAFDDIVDYSKLLVVADHTRLEEFGKLEERNCRVWKLPDGLDDFAGKPNGVLQGFNRAYQVAANVRLEIIPCTSEPCDRVAMQFRDTEKFLEEEEAEPDDLKALSIAYSRLIDLSAIVHIPTDEHVAEFRKSLETGKTALQARRLFMNRDAYKLLETSFDTMLNGLKSESAEYRKDKQTQLLSLVKRLQASNSHFLVLAPSIFSAESARVFLNEQLNCEVRIATIQSQGNAEGFDDIVLTGWPRARHLKKLLDLYITSNIHALAYSFEAKWFVQSRRRRAVLLNRWEGKDRQIADLTGISSRLDYRAPELPPAVTDDSDDILGTEKRLDSIRKGSPASNVGEREAREGRYISFAGRTFVYMTRTYKIPVVTGLINGTQGTDERIPLEVVDNLKVGDFVLFRSSDGSQKDLIRQIAEHIEGVGKYNAMRSVSEEWKEILHSLGANARAIENRLYAAGVERTGQVIRGWLIDDAKIGPGRYEDLKTIADCSNDAAFASNVDQVWKAIKYVRGAHMSAGMKLSKLLVEHLPGQLPEIEDEETTVDLVLGELPLGKVLILQIDEIGPNYENRGYWEVNQVLNDS